MSTRLTENRGFDAVAITVIRYRSSAAETSRPSFCQGWPVGTKTTSSSEKKCPTSLAATRCPWWMGSNVPPITPMRAPVCPAFMKVTLEPGPGFRIPGTASGRRPASPKL